MCYSPWGRKELDTTERLHSLMREREREKNTEERDGQTATHTQTDTESSQKS